MYRRFQCLCCLCCISVQRSTWEREVGNCGKRELDRYADNYYGTNVNVNVNAAAGCVAIALAQYLAWNKYPTNWQGYNFDWNEMCKNVNAGRYYYEDILEGYDVPLSSRTDTLIGRLIEQVNKPQWLNMEYDYRGEGITIKHKVSYDYGHAWLIERILKKTQTAYIYTPAGNIPFPLLSAYTYLLYCNWGDMHSGYFYSEAFDSRYEPALKSSTRSTTEGDRGNYQYDLCMLYGMRK